VTSCAGVLALGRGAAFPCCCDEFAEGPAPSRVNRLVAVGAQGNEIAIRIVAQLAPPLDVMNLESGGRATSPTAPAISLQYLSAQGVVSLGV